jgi:hypothetical protein
VRRACRWGVTQRTRHKVSNRRKQPPDVRGMNTLRIVTVPQVRDLLPEPAPASSPAPNSGAAATPAPGAPRTPARRRWLVHLAVAIGVVIATLVLGIGVLVGASFAAFKKADAYQASLAFLRNDSRVTAALGEPIENGLLPQGTIKRTGAFGTAELVYDLSGPRARGSAQVMSHRDGSRWIVDSATFVVDGRTETLTP